MVIVAVNTGMRRSEILRLRWVDVDLSNGRVLLPQTKNGDGRVVYLNQAALMVLRAQGPQLFSGLTGEQVSVAFARACRRVAIQDFHFHDLRHTAASWMRMSGADTVAQILGHKDLRMAARYQHLSPAFLSEAVQRLERALDTDRPNLLQGDTVVRQ